MYVFNQGRKRQKQLVGVNKICPNIFSFAQPLALSKFHVTIQKFGHIAPNLAKFKVFAGEKMCL